MNKKDKSNLIICIFIIILLLIFSYWYYFDSIANNIFKNIPQISIIQGYFIGLIIPDAIYFKIFWNEKLKRGVNPMSGSIIPTSFVFIGFILVSLLGFYINLYYLPPMIEGFNISLFQKTYMGIFLYILYILIVIPLMIIICLALVFPTGVKNAIKSIL